MNGVYDAYQCPCGVAPIEVDDSPEIVKQNDVDVQTTGDPKHD
jgi:hypothetical protein